MGTIVQKFGGTSVADMRCFLNAAEKVRREVSLGHQVVVVVSAMAGETNRLIALTREISLTPDASEYDVVLSAGEQISCGLLALALQKYGMACRSLLGWQIPMETCDTHARARYRHIFHEGLQTLLDQGTVVVIPGFQGVSPQGRLTTLGRGGSDITAVATAAVLKAHRCDIYTDVQGVYTADPRVVREARLLEKLSYEEMLELSSQGAKVLQNRSVSLAMNEQVRLRVLSSFQEGSGTWIVPEEEIMEKGYVRGIAHCTEDVLIVLRGLKATPTMGTKVFGPLAQGGIALDMIAHQEERPGSLFLSFTVPCGDLERTRGMLLENQKEMDFESLQVNDQIAKVSIIGSGLRQHPHVLSQAFEVFSSMGIHVFKTSTSEVKLSFLIPQEYAELAVRSLHNAYELGEMRKA